LERSRLELVRRIEERVERMFSEGLVEETRLLREGLANNRTAAQAIGYRQVMEHLSGERGLRETVEVVKARTRQYAKRQLTWFRQQLDLDWVQVETGTAGEVVARELRGRLQKEASPPCG
jgi:tRNA dimethylallyltransferase